MLALSAGIALLGAACATTPPPTFPATPEPSVGPTPTELVASPSPTTTAALAELVVRQHFAGGGFYIEGAVAFAELYDEGGTMVAAAQTPNYHLDLEILRADVEAGDYVLRSYVRPCEAACPLMDPPTDECTLALSLEAGGTVEVHVERLIGRCAATVASP